MIDSAHVAYRYGKFAREKMAWSLKGIGPTKMGNSLASSR